jgi:hypothetical protein
MTDFGPPIRIGGDKPGRTLKRKRGGIGKISNSGQHAKRARSPGRAIRDPKNSKHLPWPSRGKPIWDPRDPFIIAYRKAHPVVEAAWRAKRGLGSGMTAFDIETRDDI